MKKISKTAKRKNANLKYYVHPSAVVDQGAKIGASVKIWHFTHISSGAVIGSKTKIGQNCFVDEGAKIGRGVKIQNNVSVYRGIFIEDDVFVGPSSVFTNVKNPRAEFPTPKSRYFHTKVKKGVSIGANATIICGITIHPYAFIGAGAVVTKDVPSYALFGGVPAKRMGWVCRCGKKLPSSKKKQVSCSCGNEFQIQAGKCREV